MRNLNILSEMNTMSDVCCCFIFFGSRRTGCNFLQCDVCVVDPWVLGTGDGEILDVGTGTAAATSVYERVCGKFCVTADGGGVNFFV